MEIIGPSDPGPQPLQTGGEMCLWSSRNEGAAWSLARQITRGSRFNHSYARRPLWACDPFFAFWADGNPLALSESRLFFCDSTGGRCWQLPYEMAADFAEPVETAGA